MDYLSVGVRGFDLISVLGINTAVRILVAKNIVDCSINRMISPEYCSINIRPLPLIIESLGTYRPIIGLLCFNFSLPVHIFNCISK